MIACDLGSNTFRVVEIDCHTKERLREYEKVVRTAEGIAHTGEISDEAVVRVIEAILEAKEMFDFTHARAVTTAAMRKASNSKEVLHKIFDATGLKIEIIDGEKEAFYVRKAVENYIKEDYILMDLGGGSTELILKDLDRSFDIGIVTLVDKYEDIKEGIKKEFLPIVEFSKTFPKPKLFVATAGTPTTVAAYLHGLNYASYDYKKVNGTVLHRKEIEKALSQLLAMEPLERISWVGEGRDDLIIAGILMFLKIMDIFGFEEVTVIDDGLREGLALANC